ncbi:MAG: SUMF1/EgtB/PvdO family nonheme iron enzyme [Gammaproteobacteria bacterium]|nr:SUMF1/EgtB/PvdO family nonheme iron enzyme [Gammaproteobacteria bacterium]
MPKAFISYSHCDEDWKELVQSHLAVLKNKGVLTIWEDRQIESGQEWFNAIKQSMQEACVGITLVSRHFLASEFIHKEEIPTLLEKREKEGFLLLPIIISPCAWRVVEWLSAIQGVTPNNKPMQEMSEGERDHVLTDMVEKIHRHILDSQPAIVKPELIPEKPNQQKSPTPTAEKQTNQQTEEETSPGDQPATEKNHHKNKHDATYQRLISNGLRNCDLSAKERVKIGRRLAETGDPRPEVMDVDAMQFCLVPKGRFWMGAAESDSDAYDNEKPEEEYNLAYQYWLARYPVTVAQFRQFSHQSGYQPGDADCLKGVDNEPVVNVSWGEALAFCQWLQSRWQGQAWLPQSGWRLTLANEPEWEKAGRGGSWYPATAINRTIAHINFEDEFDSAIETTENPHPQRVYPWGDKINTEHLNYNDHIQHTSTPGAYPTGLSPYGCEDLSGNAWEWTRSQFHNYPYPSAFSKDWWKREAADDTASRVLRGGAFHIGQSRVRAAVRYSCPPHVRNYGLGFRVCLSPLPLDADPLNDGSLNG